MHNIHYIITTGDSHQNAMNNALLDIEDFGHDDNWRHTIGAVNRAGDIQLDANSRNRWDESWLKLDKIKLVLQEEWAAIKAKRENTIITDTLKKLVNTNIYSFEKSSLYLLREFANDLLNFPSQDEQDNFDILTDNYREYEYDKVGITNIVYQGFGEDNEDEQLYIVAIDMHS